MSFKGNFGSGYYLLPHILLALREMNEQILLIPPFLL